MSNTAVASSRTEDLIKRLRMSASLFMKDLEAMPEEMLCSCPGGKARSGLDLAYEVTTVNNMVADKANGQPIPMPEKIQGWMRAPEGLTKQQVIADFTNSVDGACNGLAKLTDEQLDEILETPMGPMPLINMAQILPSHIMYHSGQLNYIQTLHGDDAWHWV
jgi:hypothetical protein